MMNALAGIIGPTISSLNEQQQDTANLIRTVTGGEVTRVAQARGVTLEPVFSVSAQEFAEATNMGRVRTLKDKMAIIWKERYLPAEKTQKLGAPDRPSLLQDIMKGRRTEVEYLNGHVARKGKELGIPTPMNQAIVDLTLKIERGEVNPDPSNLELLKPYLAI
jgi:2-dehydropantoate 2-reductase